MLGQIVFIVLILLAVALVAFAFGRRRAQPGVTYDHSPPREFMTDSVREALPWITQDLPDGLCVCPGVRALDLLDVGQPKAGVSAVMFRLTPLATAVVDYAVVDWDSGRVHAVILVDEDRRSAAELRAIQRAFSDAGVPLVMWQSGDRMPWTSIGGAPLADIE